MLKDYPFLILLQELSRHLCVITAGKTIERDEMFPSESYLCNEFNINQSQSQDKHLSSQAEYIVL